MLFYHFSDLRNLVKCMDRMFPCYSLLNMTLIWLYYIVLINPYNFISGYLYFSNNLRHKRPYIGLYDNLKNLSPINGNSFQRKPKLIPTSYILQYIIFMFKTVFILEQIAENSFGALQEITWQIYDQVKCLMLLVVLFCSSSLKQFGKFQNHTVWL